MTLRRAYYLLPTADKERIARLQEQRRHILDGIRHNGGGTILADFDRDSELAAEIRKIITSTIPKDPRQDRCSTRHKRRKARIAASIQRRRDKEFDAWNIATTNQHAMRCPNCKGYGHKYRDGLHYPDEPCDCKDGKRKEPLTADQQDFLDYWIRYYQTPRKLRPDNHPPRYQRDADPFR